MFLVMGVTWEEGSRRGLGQLRELHGPGPQGTVERGLLSSPGRRVGALVAPGLEEEQLISVSSRQR